MNNIIKKSMMAMAAFGVLTTAGAVIAGETTLSGQVSAARASLSGDTTLPGRLESVLVTYDSAFEIMPGTRQ